MIAGHLQIKNDNYYMVLNYTDANGKRRQPWIPKAAYIAPMGWQVLAGLIVKALRSVISLGVCLSSMYLSSKNE